jgi:hypothetical protein
MMQIELADFQHRGLSDAEARDLRELLRAVFPIPATEHRTSKGNLSTKSLTGPVLQALREHGFVETRMVPLAGTSYGLQPDFLRVGPDPRNTIAGELQLALRETVLYDFLKHARLQAMGICNTSLELVAGADLARELNNACADFDWALTMLDNLVLPVRGLRVGLAGLRLVVGGNRPTEW